MKWRRRRLRSLPDEAAIAVVNNHPSAGPNRIRFDGLSRGFSAISAACLRPPNGLLIVGLNFAADKISRLILRREPQKRPESTHTLPSDQP